MTAGLVVYWVRAGLFGEGTVKRAPATVRSFTVQAITFVLPGAAMAIKDGPGGMWSMGLALFGILALPGMALAESAGRLRLSRTRSGS